jgi:signal transduction histidine kinase
VSHPLVCVVPSFFPSQFTPIGGMVRVSLDVSRFEVNPLASIASDQLLVAMGLDPKHRSASRGSRAHHSWHQPPASNSLEFDGGHHQPDMVRPIVPELLGTVMVKVSVQDSGPGIPLEHQAHIFEAYHQVQAGKIQQGNGTGLGLNSPSSDRL